MPLEPSSGPRTKGGLILCIDDDADGREACVWTLVAAGYEVLEAADGEEGLHLALTRPPQLVLLDLRLPRIDGWEVARRLKADPRTEHVPILVLSASVYQIDRDRALEVGCTAFLEKPCDADTLKQMVARCLAGARAARAK
ncbi:MAG: phoB [Myxococcaceae bacterium]|jgi:CheY-like chemotaxis protein|nr:phoB [Myxococcaceae bacterium]